MHLPTKIVFPLKFHCSLFVSQHWFILAWPMIPDGKQICNQVSTGWSNILYIFFQLPGCARASISTSSMRSRASFWMYWQTNGTLVPRWDSGGNNWDKTANCGTTITTPAPYVCAAVTSASMSGVRLAAGFNTQSPIESVKSSTRVLCKI